MISGYLRTVSGVTGFDTSRLLVASFENDAGVAIDDVLARLAGLPGVTHAAASNAVPLVAAGAQERVAIDVAGTRSLAAERVDAGPGFFAALGVPVVAGELFTDADASSGRPVVVVNAIVADRLLHGRNAVGAEIWLGGISRRVVGVVASYRDTPLRPPRPIVYAPIARGSAATRLQVVIRTTGDPSSLAGTVRQAIASLPPSDTAVVVTVFDRILDSASEEILGTTYPLLPLIATGIVLTAAGIYGVLAFSVERRSRELAVRIALGASASNVLRLVAGQSLRLMLAGILCGGGFTFVLTRLAQGRGGIFDSPRWPAFAIPLLLVVIVGIAATWAPWRRAARIDPAQLLK
jgi:ABC-type antimicrobial peptide transport system permease subunit